MDAGEDVLAELQAWYLSNCDGDWEHGDGIRIESLDNPGWRVKIDLAGTALAELEVEREELDRTEHDWVYWWVTGSQFNAACGPTNLTEALSTFLALTR